MFALPSLRMHMGVSVYVFYQTILVEDINDTFRAQHIEPIAKNFEKKKCVDMHWL